MATQYNTYFIQCLTSVHVGDGSSSGTIDLPIQREKVTGFPVFRDSSLRGSIREHFEKEYNKKSDEEKKQDSFFIPTFGNRNNGNANSALEVFPARLIFFPVRSFNGLFAYVTCPFILQRFVEDMEKFDRKNLGLVIPDDATKMQPNEIMACSELNISDLSDKVRVGLEEFLFDNKNEKKVNELQSVLENLMSWFAGETGITRIKTHGAIVSDTAFSYMAKLFTEKVTRNRIDLTTGVAAETGLFNEEFLPEETVLYTALGFGNEFAKKTDDYTPKEDEAIQTYVTENMPKIISIGGGKSIGKGMIEIIPFKEKTNGTN